MEVKFGQKMTQMAMEQYLDLHCQLPINRSIQFSKLILLSYKFSSFYKIIDIKKGIVIYYFIDIGVDF
jgi:hypothetical protein